MSKIFISYRREDSSYIANMLADRLEDRFGQGSVFLDVDSIPFGVDFREYINNEVSQCDVLLAIIGDTWLNDGDNNQNRKIDDPTDFVRLEIEYALKRNIPVVPVLVGKALMPLERELPDSIKALAFRNAAELRSGRDLRYHIDALLEGLRIAVKDKKTPDPGNRQSKPSDVFETKGNTTEGKNKRSIQEKPSSKINPLLGVLYVIIVWGVILSVILGLLSMDW